MGNIVPGIKLLSSSSDGANILGTWAFNNRERDGIGLALSLLRLPKSCEGEKP
jgi:hypothetical protein